MTDEKKHHELKKETEEMASSFGNITAKSDIAIISLWAAFGGNFI